MNKHLADVTVHAVPNGSDSMTANCGENLVIRGNVGVYPPSFFTGFRSWHHCGVCAGTVVADHQPRHSTGVYA